MCGIFGFALKNAVNVHEAVNLLEILEREKSEKEKNPLGGYGAGVAFLALNGEVKVSKAGKTSSSPARKLYELVENEPTRVLIGHVRFPIPEFMQTSGFKETAQPYLARCLSPNLTVVSVHNGKVANYKQLKEKLKHRHFFESEKVEFIDSEIIPHLFEELTLEKPSANKDNALAHLFSELKGGGNTAAILQLNSSNKLLHLFHKGKTRGLTVWTNDHGEIIFCSRENVVQKTLFGTLIAKEGFRKIFGAGFREDKAWKHSFRIEGFL